MIVVTLIWIGLCFILKYGSILNPIREFLSRWDFFKRLFKCALCLGFHIGFWSIGLMLIPIWLKYFDAGIEPLFIVSLALFFISFAGGCYSAAVCWIADHIIMALSKYINEDDDNPPDHSDDIVLLIDQRETPLQILENQGNSTKDLE